MSEPGAKDALPAPWQAGRFRFRLERAALAAAEALARLLPRGAAPAAGAVAGGVFMLLARRRRAIAMDNLRRAFGETAGPAFLRRVLRGSFVQFGRIIFEGLMFPRWGPADAGRRIRYSGLEHIRGAYASGRGVLLFSAHYGNWELVALMQGYLGLPLTMVTRPLDNPYLERRLARLREASGNQVLHKRHALRAMLAALAQRRGIAIVIDQNVRDGSALFVDFFGRPAATTPVLALLALRRGAAVVPVFAVPGRGGSYDVEYLPAVEPVRSGDRGKDLLDFTQRCTAIIEERIRRRPEAWLWMHERWKTRPRGEALRAARAPAPGRAEGEGPAG